MLLSGGRLAQVVGKHAPLMGCPGDENPRMVIRRNGVPTYQTVGANLRVFPQFFPRMPNACLIRCGSAPRVMACRFALQKKLD